jgi:foldase protein PrsA
MYGKNIAGRGIMNKKKKSPNAASRSAGDKQKAPNYLKYALISLAVIAVIIAGLLIYLNQSGSYVAKMDNVKIGKGEFSYYLNIQMQAMLEQAISVDPNTDESTFWDTKINGENAIDVAKKKALESLREVKIQLAKAKEADITLTGDERKNIESWLKERVINDEDIGNGNRLKADKYLKENYGLSLNELQKFNENISLVSKFQSIDAEKADITEKDIESYYNSYPDWYKESSMRTDGEEAVWARHILISAYRDMVAQQEIDEAREKAEDILAKVKAGEDFATLAKENSEDGNGSEGGSYVFGKGFMVDEFEEAAFTISPGQENAVLVQTYYGFHVLMVEERYEEGQPVSLRCASEYSEYGTGFIKSKLYKKKLEEWKAEPKYSLVINQPVYDSIN